MPAKLQDLIVVGGGTAGLVSAMIAAGAGARVILIERDRTGGDCLWTGCVPSKALLAAADLAHRMRTAGAVGLEPVEPRIDLRRVMRHVHGARETIAPQDSPHPCGPTASRSSRTTQASWRPGASGSPGARCATAGR